MPPERAPPWFKMEQSVYTALPPLSCITARSPPDARTHPIISHMQGIWKKVSRLFKMSPNLSLSAGLWANPKLCIGKSTFVWKKWVVKDIRTLWDLYEDNTLKSSEKLVQQHNLPRNQFWRYLQLRHLLVSTSGSPQSPPSGYGSANAHHILAFFGLGHEASIYYSLFMDNDADRNKIVSALKTVWERDLGLTFGEKEWDVISGIPRQVSTDIKTRQLKKFHCFYWTPSRLFRLGLKENPDCWKCRAEEGSLVHALWTCPKISDFWNSINDHIVAITETEYEFGPGLYVLGNPRSLKHISKPVADWIQTSITIGRQIIMRGRRSLEGPSFNDWLLEISKVAAFEKISLT